MVHRIPGIPEAWLRAARSLLQNVLSVAVTAGGAAVVTAGPAADPGTFAMVGGQAALAAVLAYVHNQVKPAGSGVVGEVRLRAGRTLAQNLVAGAVFAAGGAVAGGGDLKTMGFLAVQAALAAVISGLYNLARPLSTAGAGASGGSGSA
ncbi:hypothetical protein [Streptosporangium sp. NPDC002524]|uniref:hypothetical protein n=1 Tax=Streptosporangium sp. NPDC002524 TaxID=3154537 RepID=UPI003330AE54